MKAFIYVRQSVGAAEADESLSLEVQEAECRKFAAANGIEIIDVFREPNKSGRLYPSGYEAIANADITYTRWVLETKKSGQWRSILGDMLRRLDEIQCIICYDITRLHRSLQGSFLENLIIQTLNLHGVKVLTIKEGEIDFKRFTDTLVTTLTSQINSEQLNIQREKSKASTARLKESGEWSGQCFKSFGYRSTGRKREVEIDPMKAEIVKTIYKMFIQGSTYWAISKAVNPDYYKATGKTVWKPHMIRILKNPIYAGYYRNKAGELIKAKPNEGKEIIDFSTWKKAQDILNERKEHPRRAKVNWLPLSGRVFCGYCGDPMRASKCNKDFILYQCISRNKHGMSLKGGCKCGCIFSSERELEGGDYLLGAVSGLLPLYFMHKLKQTQGKASTEVQDMEILLHNLKSRQSAVTTTFMDGLLDETAYASALKQISTKIKETTLRIDELKATATENDYTWRRLLIDLNALQDVQANEDIEEAFRWTIEKVTVYRDKIRVKTPAGSIELPKKRIGHANLFPSHQIAVGEDKSVAIIYYYGDFTEEGWTPIGELGGIEYYLAK